MQKILLLVVVLILLIGVAGGAYFFFLAPKPEAAGEAVAEKPKPKKKSDGPPAFEEIGPIILPVIGDKGVEQNITLKVSIQVADESTRNEVRLVADRLTDAFITALYGRLLEDEVLTNGVLNVSKVKGMLLEASEKVLGPDIVDDILIQAVAQRPAY